LKIEKIKTIHLKKNYLKFIIFCCFFVFSETVSAQKTTLSGTVKDSLQNPLPYANVIAKPKDVSKNLQFAITDNEGYYKLLIAQGATTVIHVISIKKHKKRN
jgi:hypothetical protein